MSWGTQFNTDIYISRKTWNSRGELEQSIEENSAAIEASVATLRSLVSYTPKDVNDMQEALQIFDDYIQCLQEETVTEYKMMLLKEKLDEDKNIDIKSYNV